MGAGALLVLLAGILLAGCAAKAPPVAPAADVAPDATGDVVYKTVDGIQLKMGVFQPTTPGVHPAVIILHGGAWRAGDKEGLNGWAESYAAKGVAAFNVNYRLSGQAKYPAAVDDCLDAVRYLRSHAKEYNIDPDRIGAEGASAGGHLSLMLALMEPDKDAKDAQGKPLKNYGPTDLTDKESEAQSIDKASLGLFMGGTYAEMPAKYREASPVTYVSADDPPILLLQGTADQYVPYRQATIMEKRLKQAGVPVQLITVKGGGHGWNSGTTQEQRIGFRRSSEEFMIEHLKVN
jgi:acetyl esterase/lipase